MVRLEQAHPALDVVPRLSAKRIESAPGRQRHRRDSAVALGSKTAFTIAISCCDGA